MIWGNHSALQGSSKRLYFAVLCRSGSRESGCMHCCKSQPHMTHKSALQVVSVPSKRENLQQEEIAYRRIYKPKSIWHWEYQVMKHISCHFDPFFLRTCLLLCNTLCTLLFFSHASVMNVVLHCCAEKHNINVILNELNKVSACVRLMLSSLKCKLTLPRALIQPDINTDSDIWAFCC